TSVASFSGKLFVVNGDSAKYFFDGTAWNTQLFSGDNNHSSRFDTYNDHLMLNTMNWGLTYIHIYDQSLSNHIYLDVSSYKDAAPSMAVFECDYLVLIAYGNHGLL